MISRDIFGKATVFIAIFALVFAAGCGGAARPTASSYDEPQAEGEAWEDSDLEDAAGESELSAMGEEPQEGAEYSYSEEAQVGSEFNVEGDGRSEYTVSPGDNLWNISGRQVVYNDPWEWPIIFHANEDQIENPDLIKKDWVLDIPRELDTALVQAAKAEAMAAVYTLPGNAIEFADEFGLDAEEMGEDEDGAIVAAPVDTTPKKSTPKKKGAAGAIMTIIAIILLVMLIGAGVVYYLKKQKEKASLGVNQVEQPTS